MFGLEFLAQEAAEAEFSSSLSSIQEPLFILDNMAFFEFDSVLTKSFESLANGVSFGDRKRRT